MSKKFGMPIRLFSTFLIMALTVYPPVELTRLIVFQLHHPEFWISYRLMQIPEIAYIWAAYLVGMTLVFKMVTDDGLYDPWGR